VKLARDSLVKCLRSAKIARRDGEDATSVLSDSSNDSEGAEWRDEDEVEQTALENDATYQNALKAIQTKARETLVDYPEQLARMDYFLTQTMHIQCGGGHAAHLEYDCKGGGKCAPDVVALDKGGGKGALAVMGGGKGAAAVAALDEESCTEGDSTDLNGANDAEVSGMDAILGSAANESRGRKRKTVGD
jgi:hypothetical protein